MMELPEMKELIVWLREHGVRQCTYNGLTVQLDPYRAKVPDQFMVTDVPKIQLPTNGIEELF